MEEFGQRVKQGKFRDVLLEPAHDRGILCVGINAAIAVTGSMDHGLRIYNPTTGKFVRQLFSKAFGHKEWVSAVQVSPITNRVFSAGMDGLICRWHPSAVKCETLAGHGASISKLLIDENEVAISSSYDCTLRIWPRDGSCQASETLLGPHKDPILDFCWSRSLLISGDKAGTVAFWDINSAQAVLVKKLHVGPCAAVQFASLEERGLAATAGQKDGKLVLYDLRTARAIYSKKIHDGSINCIFEWNGRVVTGSADSSFSILELCDLQNCQKVSLPAGVIAGKTVDSAGLFGLSNGAFVCADLLQQKVLYGFGVSKQGSVRAIDFCLESKAVLIGSDDPSGILLSF